MENKTKNFIVGQTTNRIVEIMVQPSNIYAKQCCQIQWTTKKLKLQNCLVKLYSPIEIALATVLVI